MERRSFLALLGLAPFAPVGTLMVLAETRPEPLPSITYRTAGKWGSGSMCTLSATDVDKNFYALEQRLLAVEGK